MIENSFSKKMQQKSNQELQTIFEQKDNYTDEAIEAVVLELDARNLIEKGEVSKYKKFSAANLIKESVQKPITSKTINEGESPFDELEIPKLYSKKAIQGFTIFFSTFFGMFLLMQNLKIMNKPKARYQVLAFGIGYTLFTLVLLNLLPKMFFITLIFNIIGYAVLAEYFWNLHLGKEIAYEKKGITKPLIISLLITGFLVFLILLPVFIGAKA